jgi:hypothetical protein
MFSIAHDLSPNHIPFQKHKGFMYCYMNRDRKDCSNYITWHPGFAWAARKSAINHLGGLIDFAILAFSMTKENDIQYGRWQEPSIAQMYVGKGDSLDKKKFSLATAELILNKGIEHVDSRDENSSWNWKFEDMLPEHQQMVLNKYPNFNDPLSYIHKISKDRKEILSRMGAYNMEMFDDNNVIVRDYDTIQEKDLLSSHHFAKGLPIDSKTSRKIIQTLEEKIHGKFGVNDRWDFEKLAKKGDLNTLKTKYPFADEEMMNLAREHGYRTSGALSHAIGKTVMAQVMKLIYEELKSFGNDKFKVVFKDNKIYFIVPYTQVVNDYKINKSLKPLEKEYQDWRAAMKINWEEFINKLDLIERNIDKDAFKNAISSYEGHSRAFDYTTNR